MAMAALSEKIITPEKQILSTGQIEIANPYKKGEKTVFKDWRAQGWVDMRKAIEVSSDVYFYEIGGGFENQRGLGIANIDKYMRIFGFGSKVGFGEHQGKDGVIPTPEWKKENFKGEDWMLGDTYHTAIGQYGFQVTPLQELRAIASIANGGYLVNPRLKIASTTDVIEKKKLDFDPSFFGVVREGMRQSATDGTAKGLNTSDVKIAAKTGTAELGVSKKMVNSWVVGFFPYEKPRYAFVVIMERGPRENLIGATYVMRQTVDYMAKETPEYFKVLQ
jgi:penicillin-binding protein 2